MKVTEFATVAELSAYLFGVLEMHRRVIEAFEKTRPGLLGAEALDMRLRLLDVIDDQTKALMAEIQRSTHGC